MSSSNDTADLQDIPQDWVQTQALNMIGPVVVTAVTLIGWNSCEVIPQLQYFCLFVVFTQLAKALVGIVFKIPSKTNHLPEDDLGLRLYNGSGILIVPVIIWGGILTFNSRAPMGGEGCSSMLFLTGFANAAIPIVFIVGFGVYYAVTGTVPQM